jgi:hypothetical protein
MSGLLLSRDPDALVTEYFHWDDSDGTFTIERVQETSPFIERAKAIHGLTDGSWKGDMHLVASIPMSIYMDLVRQGITQDPVRMKQWLNDRDNRVFRTKDGTV